MTAEEHNVIAQDYRDHRALALAGRDLWENHGWMVWNRREAEQFLLWVSPYRLISRPFGPFGVRDAALSQTLLLAQDAEGLWSRDREATVQRGWSLGDMLPPEALVVRINDGCAEWSVGNRIFTANPPSWRVTGEHAGVRVDITFEAEAPAFWMTDRSVAVEDSGERWLVQCARANGWIEYGGRRIDVDGYGCHERHVHCGTSYDPVSLLSRNGVTWHSGGADDIQVLVFSRPSLGRNWSRLILQDGPVDFGGPEHTCVITEAELEVDPLSRMQVPTRWKVAITGPSGELAIDARADARTFYLWPQLSRGVTVLYWWLGVASVTYSLADGRRGSHTEMPYVVHDNRLLYRDPS